MGKSTTADIFSEMGCEVWDADRAVHRLYKKDGKAIDPLSNAFPTAIINNAVSREKLKEILAQNPSEFERLEAIVHPLVAQDRADFIKNAKADILVFDIPLLFETRADKQMDAVACVFIDKETQKKRTLARGTMTEAQFSQILAKQMPIDEKCALSDFVITTDSIEHAREQVIKILEAIRTRIDHA
jgi:dephospho-CoA kinase